MHPYKRLRELQHGMPWSDCQLVALFPGMGFCEQWAHRALAHYERRGEWFRCAPGEAMLAVTRQLQVLALSDTMEAFAHA